MQKLKSQNNWAERGIQMPTTIHKLGTRTVQQYSELTQILSLHSLIAQLNIHKK